MQDDIGMSKSYRRLKRDQHLTFKSTIHIHINVLFVCLSFGAYFSLSKVSPELYDLYCVSSKLNPPKSIKKQTNHEDYFLGHCLKLKESTDVLHKNFIGKFLIVCYLFLFVFALLCFKIIMYIIMLQHHHNQSVEDLYVYLLIPHDTTLFW